jgi:putative transposase
MDRMYDHLFDGRRLWVLTVIDTWSRVCPVMRIWQLQWRSSMRSSKCAGSMRRVDQGSQLTLRELDLWAYAKGVTSDFSCPGNSTDNAYVEGFNSMIRLEFLGQHWFLDLNDTREKVEN